MTDPKDSNDTLAAAAAPEPPAPDYDADSVMNADDAPPAPSSIIPPPRPTNNRRTSQNSTRSSASSGRRGSSLLPRRFSRRDDDADDAPASHSRQHAHNRSLRSSMSRAAQSITWAQLARRRSTDLDGRRFSNVSSANGDVAVGGANHQDYFYSNKQRPSSSSSRCTSLLFGSLTSRLQQIRHSMKKASRHPRAIVLPTLLTFAILTSAGLFAIFYSCHQYREDQSQTLLDESRELAYLLDDLLSRALLPLFTLREMVGQFEEFTELREQVVEYDTYYTEEGRAFRNVTGVCTKREVVDLFWKAAESIVKDSRMDDALLNLQLQPAGTVCLTYPPVTLNPVMDHTEAISLDRIHDIYQSTSARLSIETGEIGSTGPIVLVQDTAYEKGQESHESLIFWTPIYDEQFDLVTNDGVVYQDYWGFAGVLLDWYNVMREVGLYEFFEERDMRFALVEVLDDGTEKVVEATMDDEPVLTRETAALALPLHGRDDWVLLVDVPPPTVGDPAFTIWGSFLVIIASFLLSLALMQILVSRKDHEELLCRCIPRNIVRRLHAGETVIEKYDMATICFIDIVSFTTMSGRMKAHEVMEMLQILFGKLDRLAEKHNCFNCETIGDAYITVSGGPEGNDSSQGAANIAAFALDAVEVVKKLEFGSVDVKKKIKIRLGVASGPVVAGVIGTKDVPKFTLFGETTSKAEEMESTSLPLQVQCTEETMKLIRSNFRTNNSFQCKRRKQEGEEPRNENTWWIIRPSQFDNSCISELDDLTSALSSAKYDVDSTSDITSEAPTRSDPTKSLSMGSTNTSNDDNTKASSLNSGNDDPNSLRRNSSVIAELAEGIRAEKSCFDFENYLMSDQSMANPESAQELMKDSCLRSVMTSIRISARSLAQTFRVAGGSKRILFGTFMTFAILCAAGLAIVFVFANDYENDKIQYATAVGNKADRWLDKELEKALLPLFAMSELVKVTDKWDDLPAKIEPTPQYTVDSSVYNNVTGICDDPVYVDPFNDMASSIKNSSGMQGILVNVQLAPIGVLCLTYPKNNTEDFPPGVYLDTSGAIGLNLFDTPSRAASSKAAVTKGEKTIQGPIKLVQGNLSVVEEAIIARYPVFMDGYEMEIDGVSYPFYGLTVVLMDWEKLKTKFGIYNFFSREAMQFRMTRYDSWNDRVQVIANSSNHEILNEENSISMDLLVSDDTWTLMVGFDDGFTPSWLGWGSACVVVGSLLVSIMVMMVLATTEMNEMLLHRMMPRKAIDSIEQGKTFVERDSEATIFFSHLIGFEKMSGEMSSKDFLLMLTQLYTEFDKLAVKYECTKIETIGAYYIVKGPGPDLCSTNEREGVARIALFALHAMDLVRNYQYKDVKFQIRAGFATGPIVAGVIGSGGLPKYTVFGDTVNFSSRMESTSQAMRIQCPHLTYSLLRKSPEFVFELEEREENGELGVYVKGKGQTMTYWLNGYTKRGSGNDQDRLNSLLLNENRSSGDASKEGDGNLDLDLEAMTSQNKRVSFKE